METSTISKISKKETLGFQTEVKQLLNLMIHSLYSNKEVFLRELISNASDACDKLRFQAISNDQLYEGKNQLSIQVSLNQEARTITISDNGIGMSRDEVVEHIGTIARSGTKEFLMSLTGDQQKDAQLIGQFGVGFYSSFIVADKVILKTRKAGDPIEKGVFWESAGEGEYTIESTTKEDRGTEVILHLREKEDEFLDAFELQGIIRKFSDHISLPIMMETPSEKENSPAGVGGSPKLEQINRASALWARPKSQITKKEYDEFYKTVSHDFGEPLSHVHAKIEGSLVYTMLFYIPERAPFDLWTQEHRVGVKLYVKRVFIMDDAEKLLPKYLRFIRGVVDSDDLPLNVSREILQENQIIHQICSNSVKKILGLIEELSENEKEKYKTFWKEFGRVLKEGVVEDFPNKEKIAKLCRFSSSFDDKMEQEICLDDYIFRMKKDQDKIYYLIADSFEAAKSSPLLEVFRQKDIEVLLLSDRVDHWFVTHLNEYKGKMFQSVSRGDLDLDASDAQDEKEKNKNFDQYKDLLDKIKKALKEDIQDVRISNRLIHSPACIVAGQNDLDPNLQRLMESVGQKMGVTKPILEINPEHGILKRLREESDESKLLRWSQVLLDEAILIDGGHIKDPVAFVKRVNELLE